MINQIAFAEPHAHKKRAVHCPSIETASVTTQVVWCPQKWIGWVVIMGGMMPSVRTNLAHKRYDYRTISWLQNLNLSFQQRRFPFFSRTFPATRARGSRDLRPRVTRPAPAGHATCARGSLAMRRSETEISLGKPASPRGRTYHWLAIAVKPSKHRYYSGGFFIANCAGKKCTAPCSCGSAVFRCLYSLK